MNYLKITVIYFYLLERKNDWREITQWFKELIERISQALGSAVQNKKNRHIDQMLLMLEENYGEQVTLSSIAEQLGLSPSYVSRIFKEEQGVTFLEYLTEVRMKFGKQLIATTNLKIKEIGERVGYVKTTYFIKLFKEATGMTPGEYRKHMSGR